MRQTLFLTLLLCASVCWMSCKGGDSGNPGSPSAPPAPPSNPGTVVSQNGCSVTYACPNVDASGNANPSTPTFDRLTVSNGTSSACKVDHYRNTRPNPGANIPIEFTIRNPERNHSFFFKTARCEASINTQGMNTSVATAGPYQVLAEFGGPGPGGTPCDSSGSSGETFAQNLTLEIHRTSDPSSPVVAACGVTLWGYVTPNR